MNTRWVLLGAVQLSFVAGSALGDDCCEPPRRSQSCAAPSAAYSNYSQPAPATYSQPLMTYSQPMTYSAPVVYSQPMTYSMPVTYSQPAYVQPVSMVAAGMSVQSVEPNCAGSANVSSQSVLTTLLPILLPKLLDAILDRQAPPPVSGTVEARLANLETRLLAIEARMNSMQGSGGKSDVDRPNRPKAGRRRDSASAPSNAEILKALGGLKDNTSTMEAKNQQIWDFLMQSEAFKKSQEQK